MNGKSTILQFITLHYNADLEWLAEQDVERCKEACERQVNRDRANSEVVHCTDRRVLCYRHYKQNSLGQLWVSYRHKTYQGVFQLSYRRKDYLTTEQTIHLTSAFCTTHTHTRLMALFPGLPRWAGTRKEKPIWILLKQDTVSGSGISWAVCKSAPRSRQIATPAPHHSVFYRLDALPAAQPTASKHWRDGTTNYELILVVVTTSCPSSRGWVAWSCDLLTGAWLNSRLISWVAWVLACLV